VSLLLQLRAKIYGRTIGNGVFRCPACQEERAYLHQRLYEYLTLFGVFRLFKLNELGEELVCQSCDERFTVAKPGAGRDREPDGRWPLLAPCDNGRVAVPPRPPQVIEWPPAGVSREDATREDLEAGMSLQDAYQRLLDCGMGAFVANLMAVTACGRRVRVCGCGRIFTEAAVNCSACTCSLLDRELQVLSQNGIADLLDHASRPK